MYGSTPPGALVASSQTSFGVRLSRNHRDKRTPKDVCEEANALGDHWIGPRNNELVSFKCCRSWKTKLFQKLFSLTNFEKFAKLSDHTEIAYISAGVWSSFAYKTNKMAVSEMLEQIQFVTDWSVKNNSKDTLSEKIRWYFNIFADQFRTIQAGHVKPETNQLLEK